MRFLLRRSSVQVAGLAALALLIGTAPAVAAPAAPSRPAPSTAPTTTATDYTPASCNKPGTSKSGDHIARCFAVVRTAKNGRVQPHTDAPPEGALGPAQLKDAYRLPGTGQGQTVAIVDAFGDTHAEADLAAFRSEYGLPACTTDNGCFTKVDEHGGTNYPVDDKGWAVETSLDLDAVSAACPNCHILLVQGATAGVDSLGIAVDTAVRLGAKFVSNSYGIPNEFPSERDYDRYYDHSGVAVVASTGDVGAVQSFPSTNPNVVAVGGTTLTADASAPRGWREEAWADGGSGCSLYEARPAYQSGIDTGCPNARATADVSADADPATGLAVYDTLGQDGWLQVGGTSLAAPLVAAMYALAGTPAGGTYPVSYPYEAPSSDLFDVTAGSNGSCGNVVCQSGRGWDGPSGVGTPNGVKALAASAHGDIAGTVTDSGTGRPIEGATVSTPEGYSATTDALGHYDLHVAVGSYDVTAEAFGYTSTTRTGLDVGAGRTISADFALAGLPRHTLSGTVTDGSGHGWPLYGKITVDGYHGAVYTDPFTGHYTVELPQRSDYILHVSPVYSGYATSDVPVHVGAVDLKRNVKVLVDASTCTAPGYAYRYDGVRTDFEGWTGSTPKDGWTVTDGAGSGYTWRFDDPGSRGNRTGGSGDFAIIDPTHNGVATAQDASLVSPVLDLTGQASPEIDFASLYSGAFAEDIADVDVSIDGGTSWAKVWEAAPYNSGGALRIAIPLAAGHNSVRIRFHYVYTPADDTNAIYWQVDDVFIGNRACDPVRGGLVTGLVSDGNTHGPVNGTTVTSPADAVGGIAATTPEDSNLPDGFYWLESSTTGARGFTASYGHYSPAQATVSVVANRVTRQDWILRAGHLTVTPGKIAVSEALGGSKTAKVTLGNDGTEPVHVTLGEHRGGFTPMSAPAQRTGAPLQRIDVSGQDVFGPMKPTSRTPSTSSGPAAPSAAPWVPVADYPTPIANSAVAYNSLDGKVYSVGGVTNVGAVPTGYAYSVASQRWQQIASLPDAISAAAGAFIDGTMYVAGGWRGSGATTKTVYAYHPTTNTWSQVADLPRALSAASVAVLAGQMYVIGGCLADCAPTSATVYRYDAGSDRWSQLADYPQRVEFAACAGLAGEVICAGGADAETDTASTYRYHPDTDTWTKAADMPYDNFGMAYGGANGKLQVASGVTENATVLTNRSAEYDPATDTWSALPNANNSEFRGGSACGLYQVGGLTVDGVNATAHDFAELLPGYDQCGAADADVPWLIASDSAFDLAPGQSVTVTIALDSTTVAQPGSYAAKLSVGTDSPYVYAPVDVAMQVKPPAAWGKVTGTVIDAGSGAPLSGATVRICTMYNKATGDCGPVTYTLKTDGAGRYVLWLNKGYSPLQIIAAKDLYVQQTKIAKVTAETTTTLDFALRQLNPATRRPHRGP